MTLTELLQDLCSGLPLDPLPPRKTSRVEDVPHAPIRTPNLSLDESKLAVRNALRYFPSTLHAILAEEFAEELRLYGHIYMYRFLPNVQIKSYPIEKYPADCRQAAAIMVMIMNVLDPRVAQFPHELVTYGGNGQVFSNWAQFWIVMHYLSIMTEEQTLVLYSGHPAGLFPSLPSSPRMVITNGMMVPNYSSRDDYEKYFSLGVTMYGQMTAGSFCYIGPQGIVHGTTLTVMNAGRRHLGSGDLTGKVFVSSGLGGMSGAQPKAGVIAGCIAVIAEVSSEAMEKRYVQGWIKQKVDNLDECINMIRTAKANNSCTSIGFLGNVVKLWERLAELAEAGEMLVELGSDQTSCHNPFLGGYYPVQLTYDESREMMHNEPARFKELVHESLRRQVAAIDRLSKHGLYFFDYGNAFLLESSRAGADVKVPGGGATEFRYPSYVQHIMGDIFSLGFGPFRWVCTSCDPADLELTDAIACHVQEELASEEKWEKRAQQYRDNIKWIKEAGANQMVVGSQARILYSDQRGRIAISLAFNDAIASGKLKGPVVLSRDHHDVSGTDSPFRETSNIYDGSAFCADMSVQNCIGDSFRGATWVALHNGGGVGWGEVMNGGFGLVLDGSENAAKRAQCMLQWDVSNGVARRCWAGNENAHSTITEAMERNPSLLVTLPNSLENENLLDFITN